MIRMSVNRSIIDKPPRGSSVSYAEGFRPVEISQKDFIESIKRGFAFSAQFKDEYRNSKNFICSDFIAVDVDEGLTLQDAITNPFVQANAAFIYTTPSHTDLSNRFRIVFITPKTVTSADIWKKALQGIGRKFGGDPSIKDAARLFYGNRTAQVFEFGKTLSQELFDQILLLSHSKISKSRQQEFSSYKSNIQLLPDTHVLTANHDSVPIISLTRGQSIFCPIHTENNPSAFIVESKQGIKGVHCSVCNSTFWTESIKRYSFDTLERVISDRKTQDDQTEDNHPWSKDNNRTEVVSLSDQYLPLISYKPGITLVRSPKGSGKTAALMRLISTVQQVVRGSLKNDLPRSILLIGHRQTLLREACKKLGLSCYLDTAPNSFYGVSLDSIGTKLNRKTGIPPYDLIIIDESEQVFSHLMSETIRNHENGLSACFDHLSFYIRSAKAVVCLDADLDLITCAAMEVLRPNDWLNRLRIINNVPKKELLTKPPIQIFRNKGHLYSDLLNQLRVGKKCFVTSNSKKQIDEIEIGIRKSPDKNIIKITSDNSQDPEIIDFVKNIATRALDVDVILASPSLGTGVDITFSNNSVIFENVYGFFEPFINTHTDIDQQIARVRHPREVKVFINPRSFEVETDAEVILEKLGRAHFSPRAVRILDDGAMIIDKSDPLLRIASNVISYQQTSKSSIYRHFIDLQKRQGIETIFVEKDSGFAHVGSSRLKGNKIERVASEREVFLTTPVPSQEEFFQLYARKLKGQRMRTLDQQKLHKALVSRSIAVEIDKNIVDDVMDARFLERVSTFHNVLNNPHHFATEAIVDFLITENKTDKRYLSFTSKEILVGVVLTMCNLIEGGRINLRRSITQSDLGRFVRFCEDNNVSVSSILGRPIRKDVGARAIMSLNIILSEIGLCLTKLRSKKSKGKVSNFYVIDRKRLDRMERYSSLFKPISDRTVFEEADCVKSDGTLDYRKFQDLFG